MNMLNWSLNLFNMNGSLFGVVSVPIWPYSGGLQTGTASAYKES